MMNFKKKKPTPHPTAPFFYEGDAEREAAKAKKIVDEYVSGPGSERLFEEGFTPTHKGDPDFDFETYKYQMGKVLNYARNFTNCIETCILQDDDHEQWVLDRVEWNKKMLARVVEFADELL